MMDAGNTINPQRHGHSVCLLLSQGVFRTMQFCVITSETRVKIVWKQSAAPSRLCLASLSLQNGFGQLRAHRLGGEGWKERCNQPGGRPAANSSSAAVEKGSRSVSAMVVKGLARALYMVGCWSVRQTLLIDLYPVAELSALPQAKADTSAACSLHWSNPQPQIIDHLAGDFTHYHVGINSRHPTSERETHKLKIAPPQAIPSKLHFQNRTVTCRHVLYAEFYPHCFFLVTRWIKLEGTNGNHLPSLSLGPLHLGPCHIA